MKVGQRWQTRDGEQIFTIESLQDPQNLVGTPVQATSDLGCRCSFTLDGYFWADGSENDPDSDDLVLLVSEVPTTQDYKHIFQALAKGKEIQAFQVQWNAVSLQEVCQYIADSKPADQLRVKPNTITIGGQEFNAPETISPAKGTNYYLPTVWTNGLYRPYRWNGDDTDKRYLARTLVFLNKEDAIAASKALIHQLGGTA